MSIVKTVAAVALAATLSVSPFLSFTGVNSSIASAQQVSNFHSDDFYAPTPIIPGKVTPKAPGNPVVNINLSEVTKNDDFVVLSDVYYQFTGLGADNSISSKGSVKTTKKSDIYITLTQWSPSSIYSPQVKYTLRNKDSGKETDPVPVNGSYTNENKTIGWTRVLPGDYQIVIYNVGKHELAGNGFANAYYNYD
ncbi:hypothetical protein M5X06_00105 [Paenibacillus alvei]|uniref:Uncharacterized protein n=1 Tax=Paenibacillus alvei TaxID=44250 RepID=A0ABT4GV88_PAEAL|nr:hypothetical protein [Paenibacillus alvei]MCY9760623.1 hypothetical protein [Paenibacillus alvei]MCY9765237.1 hypothetical protein [Paenibacillus alvei]NEZ44380.1 hypothetical protein [Paenibacillus alvei]